MDDEAKLISIGQFAARTRLTTKALRLYHSNGLLLPWMTDEETGYRRYSLVQVPLGRLVGLLRSAGLSLEAIRSVIEELPVDVEYACARLDALGNELDRELEGRRLVIRHVQSILRTESDPMFEIRTRAVPAQRVMSIQRRLFGDETEAFVTEAKAAFIAHLGGIEATGPFTLIFHGPVNDHADGPIEATLGVPLGVDPTDAVGIRSEPAHVEAYTTITKRQWEFPAILAAYDAVACSEPVLTHPKSALSCREVYLTEPDTITEDELLCDVAYPLGREH